MVQFPNMVQAALLFDRLDPVDIDAVVSQFIDSAAKAGAHYNRIENKPGAFHRIYGDDTMVTVEYICKPAQTQVFEAALSTPFTRMTNPDALSIITQHRSHVLINVHHGVFPPTKETVAFMQKLDLGSMLQGHQPELRFRGHLSLCRALALTTHVMGRASLVHWTTSDQLLRGELFAELAADPGPSLLHVHPLLFDGGKDADGRRQVTLKTFGAAYFIGREIHLAANPLPLPDVLAIIFAFLKVATVEHGYVIPDGNTFGDEAGNFSCGVRHIPEGGKSGDFDGPLYRLELLRAPKHDYVSPAYLPPERTFDDRSIPADVLEDLGDDPDAVIRDWTSTRSMAEGIGGRFKVNEVKPPRNGLGFFRMFQRRKPSGKVH